MTLSKAIEVYLPTGAEVRFGELLMARSESGVITLCHRNDAGRSTLLEISGIPALREFVKWTDAGAYRPLRTAPTLRGGWIVHCSDVVSLLDHLDAVYPGAIATTLRYLEGSLDPVPLRETLDRQTGMYRFAGTVSNQDANRLMRELCSPGCLRKIAWPIDASSPVARLRSMGNSVPLICTEACTFAVSEARRLAREAYEVGNAPVG
jgi:sirohydrochlorin cobaltochelatase